jgi:hypothetical protein
VAAVVVIVSASTPRAAARTRLAGRARAIIPAWRARATSRTRQLRSQST